MTFKLDARTRGNCSACHRPLYPCTGCGHMKYCPVCDRCEACGKAMVMGSPRPEAAPVVLMWPPLTTEVGQDKKGRVFYKVNGGNVTPDEYYAALRAALEHTTVEVRPIPGPGEAEGDMFTEALRGVRRKIEESVLLPSVRASEVQEDQAELLALPFPLPTREEIEAGREAVTSLFNDPRANKALAQMLQDVEAWRARDKNRVEILYGVLLGLSIARDRTLAIGQTFRKVFQDQEDLRKCFWCGGMIHVVRVPGRVGRIFVTHDAVTQGGRVSCQGTGTLAE
jgi:hypothetical protein